MTALHRYAFVVNPAAGHGSARRSVDELRDRIDAFAPESGVYVPDSKQTLRALVRDLETRADRVVAVGGDGTIHDVVAGLCGWSRRPTLGILPLGTGNDLARMLGYGRGLRLDLDALLHAGVGSLDLGRATWRETGGGESSERTQTFVNAVGVGFDARVAVVAGRLKFLPGSAAAYLGGVIGTLARWKAPHVRIRMDDRSFDGSLLLASVCNGRSVGGGFLLAPRAEIDDGLLDLCLVRAASRRRILTLLPRAFTTKLGEQPEVDMRRVRRLVLESDEPLTVHADGEILSERLERLVVDIVPDALDVLRPVG